MLIPNAKFLVLPLVALAVIAGLPSPGTGDPQGQTRVVTIPSTTTTGCDQPRGQAPCVIAKLSTAAVVR
jgi:hypothetical protein